MFIPGFIPSSVANYVEPFALGYGLRLPGSASGAALLTPSSTGALTITGGDASGGTLTLISTSHATKGKILFGTSAYDEVNNRLGVGTTSPQNPVHLVSATSTPTMRVENTAAAGFAAVDFFGSTGVLRGFVGYGNSSAPAFANLAYFGAVGDLCLTTGGAAAQRVRITGGGNIGFNQTTFGTSAVNVLAVANGTAPSTSPADSFQHWAADQAAGNSAPHWRTENGGVFKLWQAAGIADADGTLADLTTKFNTWLARAEAFGILAAA